MARSADGQRGLVLIVVLSLITIASLVALNGMQVALVNERVAANQRLVTEAFMAADTGWVQAGRWWEASTDGEPNHRRYWNDASGALAAIGELDRTPRPGLRWTVDEIRFEGDVVWMTSRGAPVGGSTVREISVGYRRPASASMERLAPMTLAGPLGDYSAPDLRGLTGSPEADAGPAIATVSADDAERLRLQLSDDELERLPGGIDIADSGLSDAEGLRALVDAIARAPGAYDGPLPGDLGSSENPGIRVVRGTDGQAVDLHLTGRVRGAGILVVTGNLSLEQAPDFSGLIMVLGEVFEIHRGAGRIDGAIVLHRIADTAAREWSTDPNGSGFRVAGRLELGPGREALNRVWDLLPGETRALWEELAGTTGLARSGRLFGWSESPRI
ncbi:hypothetical protein TVNIR_0387 [Thioalkalivibrio nitratireducens DSM 14787]|uniref:Type 4 fimbrial biogenesis protein PilX N-terminal domain-containing protein n=1 Tax=Thioalkalivibrio nitratireducens (strain DSM 14787 / UNIQEM 213 / ALEN2) TaxID=1255043 RepID=L0DSY3_THIND|nr:PilX N-terminal domain-containing pilus assembly protein [Thioalkalivibrio nitratireducens]AGA32095.1 hypothetical protein TVNIR_0387 [Thioalkalivibrio nitratireducens DSM 14787]